MHIRKKLIEVALPLEAINVASAREKSIRHGHPSTLHLWWARRPLAAARAVIFSQMVDDPSEYVDTLKSDPTMLRKAKAILKARKKIWDEADALARDADRAGIAAPAPGPEPQLDEILAEIERKRLFGIIEKLVKWENTTNEKVLNEAREEIWQSWRRTCAENVDHPRAKELFDRHKLPAFHDPFAGGGALPLEAQRLGLEAYASDLNPVAVLINKAMIEIPPKFAGRPPMNPAAHRNKDLIAREWTGAHGLAEDVRYYGQWMRDEAEKRIGHLYPKYEITPELVQERPDLKKYLGQKLTVIAWLWARTVKSPNPGFADIHVPLVSTFMLSTKSGHEAYVHPVIENAGYRFTVKVGKPKNIEAAKNGTKLARGANFQCIMSGTPMPDYHIYEQGKAGFMSARLMAVVAEGDRGRVYLPPTKEHEEVATKATPAWKPDMEMPKNPRWFSPPAYGLTTYGDLFTDRQLVALTTFSDLVQEARARACKDAAARWTPPTADDLPLEQGGTGPTAYADAVAVYLGISVSKLSDAQSSLCRWKSTMDQSIATFGRQALPMVWDYSEANALGGMAGDPLVSLLNMLRVVERLLTHPLAYAVQEDAQKQSSSLKKIVSTDPPYYDNIGYADLSDYFYVWLRHNLQDVLPSLFSTMATPKDAELVASPYRHGGRLEAEKIFLIGMTRAMWRIAEQAHRGFPVTIYYAFKQSETHEVDGTTSTGWVTFLEAVIDAGFTLSGTWPIRTELANRNISRDTNALASSIVLVCRKRPEDAPTATRREFVNALKAELPAALAHLQKGNIAPVDLAQAAIGPGMAVFTRYQKVLDAEGKRVPVREALALINEVLDEALAEQEGDFDGDSRWALTWFDQYGFDEGEFGVAEQLSKSKNTSVAGMMEAGIVASKAGKVRLLRPAELPIDWHPALDNRLTVWECVHHLIRVLESRGESGAAELVAALGAKADTARELCYRLYTLCERKKRAAEALAYNGLVQSWPEITRLARETKATMPTETAELF